MTQKLIDPPAMSRVAYDDREQEDDHWCTGCSQTWFQFWAGCALCTCPCAFRNDIMEYERGLLFRFGAFVEEKGPGMILLRPGIETLRKVDTRVVTCDLNEQSTITKDSVSVMLDAVVYYYVHDCSKAVLNCERYAQSVFLLAQTTLRAVSSQYLLDDLLQQRTTINHEIARVLGAHSEDWGVRIQSVEIRDVKLPSSMMRAMAVQAQAERERRAKIISAEGELQASSMLAQAAHNMSKDQYTMYLRYMQTVREISQQKTPVSLVVPWPFDFQKMFSSTASGNSKLLLGPPKQDAESILHLS
jgi:hypothetical protein